MASVTRNSTANTAVSQGRKSLRSASSLDRKDFKGDRQNPAYAVDADVEGISNAVDRSDEDLNTLNLGRKYSEIFGNAEWVIVDIEGTLFPDLHTPVKPYPGALEAVKLLKDSDLKVILMTNSWRASKHTIVEKLKTVNFEVSEDDIFTSSDVCKIYLEKKGLKRPYYLAHHDVIKDFSDSFPRRPNEDCVIVGLPSTLLDYRLISKGMSLLHDGAPMIVLNMMKKTATPNTKNISLGPGPFVNSLSCVTDSDPVTVCKPSWIFYESLAKKIGLTDYSKAVVIGDDIYEDIVGAKMLGFKAILTRTGRYNLHDEKVDCGGMVPDATAENFAMGVRCVLSALAVSIMSDAELKEEDSKSSKGCGSFQSSMPKGEFLSRRLEAYLRMDTKQNEKRYPPLKLPSFIW